KVATFAPGLTRRIVGSAARDAGQIGKRAAGARQDGLGSPRGHHGARLDGGRAASPGGGDRAIRPADRPSHAASSARPIPNIRVPAGTHRTSPARGSAMASITRAAVSNTK